MRLSAPGAFFNNKQASMHAVTSPWLGLLNYMYNTAAKFALVAWCAAATDCCRLYKPVSAYRFWQRRACLLL
jgi:hypothetical protein